MIERLIIANCQLLVASFKQLQEITVSWIQAGINHQVRLETRIRSPETLMRCTPESPKNRWKCFRMLAITKWAKLLTWLRTFSSAHSNRCLRVQHWGSQIRSIAGSRAPFQMCGVTRMKWCTKTQVWTVTKGRGKDRCAPSSFTWTVRRTSKTSIWWCCSNKKSVITLRRPTKVSNHSLDVSLTFNLQSLRHPNNSWCTLRSLWRMLSWRKQIESAWPKPPSRSKPGSVACLKDTNTWISEREGKERLFYL
jgi:hypothetical protein